MTQAILSANPINPSESDSDRRVSGRIQMLRAVLPSLHTRPAWLNGTCLALIWIALLIYGTLIPFDFDLAGHSDRFPDLWSLLATALTSVRWRPATGGANAWIVDLVTNLLLYGPLGLFVRWGAQRHGCRVWSQILITVIVLFLVSYLLECAQSLTPSRVGSWYDVIMNTTGGLLFALAAGIIKTTVCTTTFWIYRKVATILKKLMMAINTLRHNRTFIVVMLSIDCLLILFWYGMTTSASVPSPHESNWLPFARQFEMSYDKAMVDIGHHLMQYGLLTLLLSAQFLSMPIRRRTVWLVFTVVILTTLPYSLRSNSHMFIGDMTEPTLALTAVACLVIGVHGLAHAIRKSDRRKSERRKTHLPIENDLRRFQSV